MIERILSVILPVLGLVLVGYLYGRRIKPDMTWVNKVNIDVSVPALVFSALSSRQFDFAGNVGTLLGTLAVVLGSGLLSWPVAKWLKADTKTFVPPMMFNNSANMGLPLALLAFGEANLNTAVILFVATNLLHFTLGVFVISHRVNLMALAKSPMIWATILGLIVSIAGWKVPQIIAVPVKLLGDIVIPAMLFSLGVRMVGITWHDWKIGVAGAITRPVTGLIAALAAIPFLPLPGVQQGMLLLYASLPPAVLNFLIAEQYKQEPNKVASIVLLGNLASLIFVPVALVLAFRGQ